MSGITEVKVVRHENGSHTANLTVDDANLTIAAGPGCTPAHLRAAVNALRPHLMPGTDHA